MSGGARRWPMPAIIAHADWSTAPSGRALWRATRAADTALDLSLVLAPSPDTLISTLADAADGGTAVLGIDSPLGMPRSLMTAERRDFLRTVLELSPGDPLFEPARSPADVATTRPFYPASPGGAKLEHLERGLGVKRRGLLRACDVATNAACMFWTMGPQQCGKTAIAVWRDVLGPALRSRRDVAVWPYAGPLGHLLARPGLVLVETYPGYGYRALGLGRFGKATQEGRRAACPRLQEWTRRLDMRIPERLSGTIEAGFPAGEGGDHAFDALVGLVLMVAIVTGALDHYEPEDPVVRSWEGWMLGLGAPGLPAVARHAPP